MKYKNGTDQLITPWERHHLLCKEFRDRILMGSAWHTYKEQACQCAEALRDGCTLGSVIGRPAVIEMLKEGEHNKEMQDDIAWIDAMNDGLAFPISLERTGRCLVEYHCSGLLFSVSEVLADDFKVRESMYQWNFDAKAWDLVNRLDSLIG